MDPITLGIISMLAGGAMQYHAASQAAERQKQQAVQAQQRQLAAQNQATQVASKKAAEFDPAARQQAQDEIRDDLTQKFETAAAAPQITAQGVQVGATIPDSAATQDFTTTKARESAKTAESMRQLAQLMGRIGATSELRRREGVGFGDAAGAIGRIQTGAGNVAGIDNVGIQAAGVPNLAQTIAGQALSAYGAGGIAGAGLSKAVPFGQVQGAASGATGAWL